MRVTIWFTIMMTIIVALVIIFMLVVGKSVITNNAETTLFDVVHDNVDDIDYDNGILDIDEVNLYRHNVYIMVYDADENLIGGAGLRSFDGDDQFLNGVTREVDIDGEQYLVYDLYVQNVEGDVWIRGVTSPDNSFSAVRIVIILSIIIFPVLVVLAAVGGWFIAWQAFKPVRQINDTVNAITDGNDLSARIGLKSGRDEIHRLSETFDRMFDRLEKSFNSEKRFVSDASHELRTPTSVILAECEFARQNGSSIDDYRDTLEVVERQAQKMSMLINQLLGMTRLDQGTQKTAIESASLSDLTDIVCDEIAVADKKNMTLEKDIEENVFAPVDVGLMTRLVQNLVENAYKYTPDGGTIRVSLHRDGENAVLTVADNGIGIEADDLAHIWDRFWQADPSRGTYSGSGLGLSIVKQIAEVHGGTIAVESEFGKGTSFTFTMKTSEL